MNVTLKSLALVVFALSPAACASEPAFEAYSETGSGTDSQSGDDGDDMGSDGVFDSSSESGDSGMLFDVGMATSDTDGDQSESGDSSGDVDAGDGDGDDGVDDSTSTDSTTGDGDGDGDGGMDKFPGDLCDPFIDNCIDVDGVENVCSLDNDWLGGDVYEYNFKCLGFYGQNGSTGTSGETCDSINNRCQDGFYCAAGGSLDEGLCSQFGTCCATLCAYGDICAGGEECAVQHFQSMLTDYLDVYTGIGFCPSG